MGYKEVWRLFDIAIATATQSPHRERVRAPRPRSNVERWHVVFGERQRPLFLPHAPHAIQQKCIRFFHSTALKLLYARCLLRLRKVLPEVTLPHEGLWTLIENILPPRLSEAIAYVAVYAGTPSPNQKASLLLISDRGELLAVVKLALRVTADSLVDNEADWLNRLASIPFIRERIPKLLAHGELASGRHYVVKTVSSGSAKEQGFTERHIRFLTALGRSSLVAAPYTESKGFRALLQSYAQVRPTLDEAAARALSAALEACSSRLAGWVGPLTLSHGEFSSWNICAQDDELFVFDWEYAEEGANPLQDALHYHLIRPAARGRKISVQEFSSVMQRIEQFAMAAYPEWSWDANIVTGLALVYLLRVVLYYAEVERALHMNRPVTRTYMFLLRNVIEHEPERREPALSMDNLSILPAHAAKTQGLE